jgi:YihY family inner membrane protein
MKKRAIQTARKSWEVLLRAGQVFFKIDGEQRAAAFSFYALFSLFPLVLLFVTLGSYLVDRDRAATEIISFLEGYVPLGDENRQTVFELIEGVIQARGGVGAVALAGLLWSSMRFFYVLVRAVNKAWDTEEHSWWHLPLKNLAMLCILATALAFGILTPTVVRSVENWAPDYFAGVSFVYDAVLFLLPLVILFYGFSMLYKLGPRRKTRFSEVWLAALVVTVLLRVAQELFVLYVVYVGGFNALYGGLGGVLALMMWVYVSGSVIIFGGCISAATADLFEGRKASVLARHPDDEKTEDV